MGLSFSRSVKFGAVRFNFSGSGIGMSVGIPGLRVGTGPRGAYVSGGVGGFRYRKSLNNSQPKVVPTTNNSVPHRDSSPAVDPNIINTIEHETKNVLELSDSSDDELLHSMNEQRSKYNLGPFVGVALLLLYFLLQGSISDAWPSFISPTVFVIFMAITAWVYWRDKMRKLTVLFYEPDQTTSELFDSLCKALNQARAARKLQSIATTSRYADTKYTAGASKGLKFGDAKLFLGQAPGVIANVAVPILMAGRTTLAFYPDRVLAFQGKTVGGVRYTSLSGVSERIQYIESETLPRDATVIDKTWQYVNKKGGPDKRFKDNRQLPVCAYSQLNLVTPDGLDVRFMGSKDGAFDALADALKSMAASPKT